MVTYLCTHCNYVGFALFTWKFPTMIACILFGHVYVHVLERLSVLNRALKGMQLWLSKVNTSTQFACS